MSVLILIVAIVCFAIATLIGFDVFHAEHELGWIALGLMLWAVADAVSDGARFVRRT